MKAYLNSLNERERWMLIGGTFCLIMYVYYLVLYAPLSHQVSQKSAQLTEKIETLAWMNKVRNQSHAGPKKKNVDNSQLLTILATQLKDNPTLRQPYQLQQTGPGDIQLTFDAVPFNLFIKWLEKLNNQYSIAIKQLDVEQSSTPGVTKLMVIMTAGS